jgi:hypothetical protein
LGCLGPHQASRVDPNATRRSVAKGTSSFARTAMAAVCVQAIWTSSAPSTSSLGAAASIARAQHSWRVRKFRPKENDTQIAVEITKRSRSRSTLCRGLCSAVSTNLHPRRRGEYRRDDGEKKDHTPANPAICKGPHHGLTAVLASSKGRLTSATPASNEKPRRWERRPGQVFAERVVTGRTDGRCSAERTITTGAVRAVLICRL